MYSCSGCKAGNFADILYPKHDVTYRIRDTLYSDLVTVTNLNSSSGML